MSPNILQLSGVLVLFNPICFPSRCIWLPLFPLSLSLLLTVLSLFVIIRWISLFPPQSTLHGSESSASHLLLVAVVNSHGRVTLVYFHLYSVSSLLRLVFYLHSVPTAFFS
ncbi:hypothetical protein CARUB_v10021752mg [Capsella rubella]|uniref:Uncharacterized protein n=1 Tax=Capsella rubella TaxID=81985 RepID=R0I807_9BRAS|nr:hypothetical protein CARUB_v10021752mg [Capsella rubella]